MSIREQIENISIRLNHLKGRGQSRELEIERTRLEWMLKMLQAKHEQSAYEKALFLLERYLNNGFVAVRFPGGIRQEIRPYDTGEPVTTFFNARGDIWKMAFEVTAQEPPHDHT